MELLSNQAGNNLEKIYFNLLLSLTVLSGTVFSSSIALSQNSKFNPVFFIGEFLLASSTLVGFLILWTSFRAQEWSYFFEMKQKLELNNTSLSEDFLRKANQNLINDLGKLIDKKGFSYLILEYIPNEKLPTCFFITFCSGLLILWVSVYFLPR